MSTLYGVDRISVIVNGQNVTENYHLDFCLLKNLCEFSMASSTNLQNDDSKATGAGEAGEEFVFACQQR